MRKKNCDRRLFEQVNRNLRSLLVIINSLVIINCGGVVFVGNPDDETEETNNQSVVNLQFSSDIPSSNGLNLQNVDLGNGVSIESARLNLGRIHLKKDRVISDEEKEFEDYITQKKLDQELENIEQEKLEQAKLEKIELQYDELIAKADSEEKKILLEEEEKIKKSESEKSLAELKAAKEQEIEAIENEQNDSLKWKDSYLYDMLAQNIKPDIPTAILPSNDYERLEFKLVPSRSTTENLDIINNSADLTGSVEINGSAIPFRLQIRQEVNFSLKGEGKLQILPGANFNLVVSFHIRNWFAGVDFSSAIISSRGSIKIDPVNNPEIYHEILNNIIQSTGFGEDKNKDGKLDDNESVGSGEEQVKDAQKALLYRYKKHLMPGYSK